MVKVPGDLGKVCQKGGGTFTIENGPERHESKTARGRSPTKKQTFTKRAVKKGKAQSDADI